MPLMGWLYQPISSAHTSRVTYKLSSQNRWNLRMCLKHQAQRVNVAAIATALATAPWGSAAPSPEEMGQRAVLLGPPRPGASGWASREGTAASPPPQAFQELLKETSPRSK